MGLTVFFLLPLLRRGVKRVSRMSGTLDEDSGEDKDNTRASPLAERRPLTIGLFGGETPNAPAHPHRGQGAQSGGASCSARCGRPAFAFYCVSAFCAFQNARALALSNRKRGPRQWASSSSPTPPPPTPSSSTSCSMATTVPGGRFRGKKCVKFMLRLSYPRDEYSTRVIGETWQNAALYILISRWHYWQRFPSRHV